ncbi:MAG: RNA polymerase subunit sigma-24 [Flavobacteriales bacterium]|nr:RNA polymerase subunit sigma-24 [Flavobacteriales bacterium]|tara:strand:+ start:27688 stop:28293 length:606 start_codon:yes stop_codon:yes gene_type:complete
MEVNENFSEKAKEDFELVKAAKRGSQAAFSQIMVRYREPLYYLAFKMVRNESDAEDLSIEAFEKAFTKIDQYTPQYAFSTWLFRIATNHCIDFIRKKKLKTTSIDEAMEDKKGNSWSVQVPAKAKDPEEKYIEKQKIALMREMVEKLSEPYQSLITMRYFKELSYEEIAQEKDIPLGTVKAQLFRARALLADLIRKSKKSI